MHLWVRSAEVSMLNIPCGLLVQLEDGSKSRCHLLHLERQNDFRVQACVYWQASSSKASSNDQSHVYVLQKTPSQQMLALITLMTGRDCNNNGQEA